MQNHTRAFKPAAGARALRGAGVEAAPDVVVPFEPTVPETMDQGWPRDQLPRALRAPLAALADLLLAPAGERAARAANAPPPTPPARRKAPRRQGPAGPGPQPEPGL